METVDIQSLDIGGSSIARKETNIDPTRRIKQLASADSTLIFGAPNTDHLRRDSKTRWQGS